MGEGGQWRWALGLVLAGCGGGPAAVPYAEWQPQALDWAADAAEITLPAPSVPAVAGPVPVSGPWRAVATNKGVRVWEAPMPVRTRTLFFHRPPHDMALLVGGDDGAPSELPFARGRKNDHKVGTWSFTAETLGVRRAAGDGPPTGLRLRYSKGVERENDLIVGVSERSPRELVFRSLQLGAETRRGIFLPGGAAVALPITAAPGARRAGELFLLPPEAGDPAAPGDGATLEVVLVDGDSEEILARESLAVGDQRALSVALPGGTTRTARLVLRTDPGASAAGDHVFLAAPRIQPPVADPPRVVMIFVDTLRADGMSTYGYHRPTTPRIDAFAADATVFETARSVAPWTLPSTRSALTGALPERWGAVPTLAARFGAAGWATAFIAGNVYLSSNFDMAADWGLHRCVNWPGAADQVDQALGWLAAHDDEPAFLVLHLMDAHLPYEEPEDWRGRFAGARPARFGDDVFHRNDIVRGRRLTADDKAYVRGRYDNNVAWIDHQLDRLLTTLDPEDVVVIFSDHGEEFWDHGGFEHGHSLYDELLRVPLIVRAPGLPASRETAPVSLLDLAPTVLRAAGLPAEGLDGAALQDVVAGEVAPRVQAFGRPLYGDRQWGAVAGSQKYTAGKGREQSFDLAADPQEQRPVRSPADLGAGRDALAMGLGWEVAAGLRVRPAPGKGEVTLIASVPGGFSVAFAGEDPTLQSVATVERSGDTARLHWPAGHRGTREIFLVPRRPLDAVVEGVQLAPAASPDTPLPRRAAAPEGGGRATVLAMGKVGGRLVKMTAAVVPVPPDQATALEGYNPEVEAELRELGYLE